MKYLKKFNEAQHEMTTRKFTFEFQEELKGFCEMYLAYLIDSDYCISVYTNTISLKKFSEENDNQIYSNLIDSDDDNVDTIDDPRNFKWDDIKNSFIPFLQHLSKQYNIGRIYMYGYPSTSECISYSYTLQQVLDDDHIVPVIYSIFLRID